MVRIQREHAGALAVVSAWISLLLPWNVTSSANGGIWVLFVRFPLFEFQYTSGFGAGVDGTTVRTVLGAIDLQAGQGLETATLVWGGGGLVLLAAAILSVLYYTNEPQLETALLELVSVHPARLMGGLIGVATLLFVIATALVWTGGFGGTPIPIGVPLIGVLSWILLCAELTDDTDPEKPQTSPDQS